MATNLYGKSCTPNLGGVLDYYTKAEVNQLLNAKANTSTIYTRSHLDSIFSNINNSVLSLESSKVSQDSLQDSLNSLQTTIENNISNLYATLEDTYSKVEVDALIGSVDLDPDTLLRRSPETSEVNTVNPGDNDAIALTVRGSSVNPTVTRWLNSSGESIGYISNSGVVTIENRLNLGRLVTSGGVALDISGKRIIGVPSPVSSSDVVPLGYLQSYILDFYEEITRPDLTTFYPLNAGTY